MKISLVVTAVAAFTSTALAFPNHAGQCVDDPKAMAASAMGGAVGQNLKWT
jgi:hypothetical protein